MKTHLLPKLRKICVVDADSLIEYHRLALDIFGYTGILKSDCDKHKPDLEAVAKLYGWDVKENILSFTVKQVGVKTGTDLVIAESAKPSKEQIREAKRKNPHKSTPG